MALVLQIASSLNGTAHDRLEYQGAHHSGWHPHRTGRSWFSHPGSISAPKHVTGSMNFANWCIWELLACCLLACCAFVHVCVFVSVSVYMTIYLQYLSIYITIFYLFSLSLSVRPSVCLSVCTHLFLSLSLPPRASVRKCADKCVSVCVCVCVRALSICLLVSLLDGPACLAFGASLCACVSHFSKTLLLRIAGKHYQIATSSDHLRPTTRQLKMPEHIWL